MNDDRWGDLIDQLEDKFGKVTRERSTVEEEDDLGNPYPVKLDVVGWESPDGQQRLTRRSHPRITDRKAHYNRASGSGAKIEYVFSPDEWTHSLKFERLDAGSNEWTEVEGGL